MAIDPNFFVIGGMIASAGSAYGITSYSARQNTKKLETHEKEDNKFHTETIDRLARIETKLDALASRKN